MIRSSFTRRVLVSIVTLVFLVGEAACSEPDWAGAAAQSELEKSNDATVPADDDDDDDDDEGDCADDGDAEAGGGGDATKIDGAACCEDTLPGKAHCVPTADLPDGTSKALSACSGGGMCVPDSLRKGSAPKSCESNFGPGVCLSLCIPDVAENAELLKQDNSTCGAEERCAPCINPKTDKESGACKIGQKAKEAVEKASSKKPCSKASKPSSGGGEDPPPAADGTKPPATGNAGCCGGKGLCVPKSAVSEDEAENLEAKECASEKLCAPKEMADRENFKPKRCKGSAITGDFEGVCLSTCLVFGTLEKIASDQGDCDDDHRCLPCEYPLVGGDTGAPGCK